MKPMDISIGALTSGTYADDQVQPGHNRKARKLFTCQCLECDDQFKAEVKTATFCSTAHRTTFNNRRKERGAELYDLLMACRFERQASRRDPTNQDAKPSVFTMLYRMARQFRDQDIEQRNGRKSWRPARKVLARGQHTHLNSVVIQRRARVMP